MSEIRNPKSEKRSKEYHCEDCKEMSEYFSGDTYTDYPQYTDFIQRWNKAYDLMGRWCLWVLRIDMKHLKSLDNLHPERYADLLRRLRLKYAELKKLGKLPDTKD